MGWEAIERLRFLASLCLAGTGQRERGKKRQPFNCFQPRLFTSIVLSFFLVGLRFISKIKIFAEITNEVKCRYFHAAYQKFLYATA